MNFKYQNTFVIPVDKTILIMLVFVMALNGTLFAQDKEKEEIEKAKVKMKFNYNKESDGSRILNIKANTKIEKKLTPVSGLEINLFSIDTSGNVLLGKITTDVAGEAVFALPDRLGNSSDSLNQFTFIAKLEENDQYLGSEKEISVLDASIEIILIDDDSVKYIKASVNVIGRDGGKTPAEETEVKFYVKRMFGLLPIGGDYTYTDESGNVDIEFPLDLPGDSAGMVSIIVKLEDDENYGNLVAQEIANWGVPVKMKNPLDQRALWAQRGKAPIWLIVMADGIVLGVWSVLIYIFIQLIKIRRLNKKAA